LSHRQTAQDDDATAICQLPTYGIVMYRTHCSVKRYIGKHRIKLTKKSMGKWRKCNINNSDKHLNH